MNCSKHYLLTQTHQKYFLTAKAAQHGGRSPYWPAAYFNHQSRVKLFNSFELEPLDALVTQPARLLERGASDSQR
jgi:hypothetical protein